MKNTLKKQWKTTKKRERGPLVAPWAPILSLFCRFPALQPSRWKSVIPAEPHLYASPTYIRPFLEGGFMQRASFLPEYLRRFYGQTSCDFCDVCDVCVVFFLIAFFYVQWPSGGKKETRNLERPFSDLFFMFFQTSGTKFRALHKVCAAPCR